MRASTPLCAPDSALLESGTQDYARKREATTKNYIDQTVTREKPR